ncbi:MAG: fused MFS/spermidine synthase [Anaerolineae bacterium]|nr:fused MFS/spermidine synthase [Anaerolineae bacterium]
MRGRAGIYLAALGGGFCSLGLEMATSRLLNNYFGSSQIVWAVLIGLILVYLTVGNYLGGRLADRAPGASRLYALLFWSGMGVGLVPFASRPLLSLGQDALERYSAGLLAGSVVGVMGLVAVPMVLLGTISPFATRLAVRSLGSSGRSAGGVYALSTVGSLLGTWITSLALVPLLGTRVTFLVLALPLVGGGLAGMRRERSLHFGHSVLVVALLALAVLWPGGTVKPVPDMIHERESPYNYIQVVERGQTRTLYLNEGQGVHSVYHPNMVLTGSVWDLFLVAPLFGAPNYSAGDVDSLCLIGLAAGTIAKQYSQVYGPIPIDGVEIDPEIIAVGRQYFDMNEPNLNPVAMDGRYFLAHAQREYDVIVVDAYRPPYIPPQLTTVEFFRLAEARLSERGVVAINVGRSLRDDELVRALASTMGEVFPSVYVVDLPASSAGLSNSMVVGTRQATRYEDFAANVAALSDPRLVEVGQRVLSHVRAHVEEGLVLTDDRAPVEELIHQLILDYLLAPEG